MQEVPGAHAVVTETCQSVNAKGFNGRVSLKACLLVQEVPEAHTVVTGDRGHNGLPDTSIYIQDL